MLCKIGFINFYNKFLLLKLFYNNFWDYPLSVSSTFHFKNRLITNYLNRKVVIIPSGKRKYTDERKYTEINYMWEKQVSSEQYKPVYFLPNNTFLK